MSFNGNEGEFITLREGSEMTKRYRNTIQPGDVIGVFMGKDKIKEILAQNECVGIRFYFAKDENNENTLVVVGADSNQNDLVNGLIADKLRKCPIICSDLNSLNS